QVVRFGRAATPAESRTATVRPATACAAHVELETTARTPALRDSGWTTIGPTFVRLEGDVNTAAQRVHVDIASAELPDEADEAADAVLELPDKGHAEIAIVASRVVGRRDQPRSHRIGHKMSRDEPAAFLVLVLPRDPEARRQHADPRADRIREQPTDVRDERFDQLAIDGQVEDASPVFAKAVDVDVDVVDTCRRAERKGANIERVACVHADREQRAVGAGFGRGGRRIEDDLPGRVIVGPAADADDVDVEPVGDVEGPVCRHAVTGGAEVTAIVSEIRLPSRVAEGTTQNEVVRESIICAQRETRGVEVGARFAAGPRLIAEGSLSVGEHAESAQGRRVGAGAAGPEARQQAADRAGRHTLPVHIERETGQAYASRAIPQRS